MSDALNLKATIEMVSKMKVHLKATIERKYFDILRISQDLVKISQAKLFKPILYFLSIVAFKRRGEGLY